MKHINEYTPSYLVDGVVDHLTRTKGYISEEQAVAMGTTPEEFRAVAMRLLERLGV